MLSSQLQPSLANNLKYGPLKATDDWLFVTCETHGFDKKETWNLSFAAQFFAILLVHDFVLRRFFYTLTDNLNDFNSYKWEYLVVDVERTSSLYHILSPGTC